MQENNFEKQVQEKMDGLRIDPSGELWQKVSSQIGKRKRDHRFLLVCVTTLLFLMIGGITWIKTASNNNNPEPQVARAQTELKHQLAENLKAADSNTTDNNAGQEKNLGSNTKDNFSNNQVQATKPTASIAGQPRINDGSDQAGNPDKVNKPGYSKNRNTINQSSGMLVAVSAGESDQLTNAAPNSSITVESNKPDETGVVIDNTAPEESLQPVDVLPVHSMLVTSGDLKTGGTDITQQDLTASIKKTTKNSPWKWGINISVGLSNTRNGYLGIVNNSSNENKDLFQSPPSGSTGNSGTPGVPANSIPVAQPDVKLNAGFIAGAFVQRDISRRISLQMGINYKYYSTSMMTGARVDSSGMLSQAYASYYYRPGNQQKYINRYHFIEIPLSLQWRITALYKLPIYLYTGVSMSGLVGSNALQFNNVNGTYFPDNDLFKKTQFDISTKLLFALGRKGNSLLLGPQLNYSLGTMSTSGMYQDRHYSYLGITLQKNIF